MQLAAGQVAASKVLLSTACSRGSAMSEESGGASLVAMYYNSAIGPPPARRSFGYHGNHSSERELVSGGEKKVLLQKCGVKNVALSWAAGRPQNIAKQTSKAQQLLAVAPSAVRVCGLVGGR